jgi:epithelial splicing regulatory protein 1/2
MRAHRVFQSSEEDLLTAKSYGTDRNRGWVLRMRGLPYTASAQDVVSFFGPAVPIVRGLEGVVFTYTPDGRPTGEAYLELQSEEAQTEALKKHKESMGSRYIELFVSSRAEIMQVGLQLGLRASPCMGGGTARVRAGSPSGSRA